MCEYGIQFEKKVIKTDDFYRGEVNLFKKKQN